MFSDGCVIRTNNGISDAIPIERTRIVENKIMKLRIFDKIALGIFFDDQRNTKND